MCIPATGGQGLAGQIDYSTKDGALQFIQVCHQLDVVAQALTGSTDVPGQRRYRVTQVVQPGAQRRANKTCGTGHQYARIVSKCGQGLREGEIVSQEPVVEHCVTGQKPQRYTHYATEKARA